MPPLRRATTSHDDLLTPQQRRHNAAGTDVFASPHPLLGLQRSIGNQAVMRLLQSDSRAIQRQGGNPTVMDEEEDQEEGEAELQEEMDGEEEENVPSYSDLLDGQDIGEEDEEDDPNFAPVNPGKQEIADEEYEDPAYQDDAIPSDQVRQYSNAPKDEVEAKGIYSQAQEDLFKNPAKRKKPATNTETMETSFQFTKPGNKNKGIKPETVERDTKKFGSVTLEMELVDVYEKGKLITAKRPIRVSGAVQPTTTTGRPGAPESITGVQVYLGKEGQKNTSLENPRNMGLEDAERGHIMALELGGPDIPENIVPQWAKFQGADRWRKMETEVLKRAEKRLKESKGTMGIFYSVEVFYKDSSLITPTYLTFGFPTGFRATVQDWDVKNQTVVGTAEEVFNSGQSQDMTDEKMALRQMQQIDGTDFRLFTGESIESKTKRQKKAPSAPRKKSSTKKNVAKTVRARKSRKKDSG